jgi:hypothetical protein
MADQLPITSYQLPVTNYQLPITNYQLPKIEENQLQITFLVNVFGSGDRRHNSRRSPLVFLRVKSIGCCKQ